MLTLLGQRWQTKSADLRSRRRDKSILPALPSASVMLSQDGADRTTAAGTLPAMALLLSFAAATSTAIVRLVGSCISCPSPCQCGCCCFGFLCVRSASYSLQSSNSPFQLSCFPHLVNQMTKAQTAKEFINKCKQCENDHWAVVQDTIGQMLVIPSGHLVVLCGFPDVAEGCVPGIGRAPCRGILHSLTLVSRSSVVGMRILGFGGSYYLVWILISYQDTVMSLTVVAASLTQPM